MATLANIQGASLVPDISQALNIALRGFGTKRERDEQSRVIELQSQEREAATQDRQSIQEQIRILTSGGDIRQPGGTVQTVAGPTGKATQKALLRLTSISPQIGRTVSDVVGRGNQQELDALKEQAEIGVRQAALVSGQKDFAGKQKALTSLAAEAVTKGQPLDRLVQLQNLDEPELDLELQRMKIMGQDLATLAGPTERFEAVTDAQGNVIAQRSTTTGRVVTDPRAVGAPTAPIPSTPIGKARADLKAGFITKGDFNTIKSTPKKFQTDVGKSIADKQLAIETFGADSDQVKAIDASIKSDAKGEGPKLSDVAGMRKEHTKLSSDTIALGTSIKKIRQGAENPSAAGDVAMIFSFMKMLDPTSVVREGEFATAAQAAGVPERIIGQYNRVLSGERLTQPQRQDFLNTANRQWDAQIGTQRQIDQNFRGLAERQNINPDDVVIDFIGGDVVAPEQAATIDVPTAVNPTTGETVFFRNGQWVTQ